MAKITLEPRKQYQYLKCQFSDAEITDIAKKLADANRLRARVEQQKKQVDSSLKSAIEDQNSIISRLSDHIATGYEYRDVEVEEVMDRPVIGMKTIMRIDTFAVVSEQIMTDEDKQMVLNLDAVAEELNASGPA